MMRMKTAGTSSMGHPAPLRAPEARRRKRAINLSLDEALVQQARLYTGNLSGTLEGLLEEFITREEARRRAEDLALDRVMGAFGAFHARHGLLSDEFSGL
jgi:antitoxin CcdA